MTSMTPFAATGPAPRERTVTRDGTQLRVLEFGDPDARPVVAVHGFASSAEANWGAAGWVRVLVKAGYRVVALDQRGHGGSDQPHDAGAYSLPILVDDLAAVVESVRDDTASGGAGDDSAVDLLGYSLGSRVCATFGEQHPDRVRTLSLGGLDDTELFSRFDVAAARNGVIHGEPIADEVTATLVALMTALPGDTEALLALAEGLHATGAGVSAPRPGAPTVVACGDRDEVAGGGEAYAASLPDATFVTLPGRTHANAVTSRAFKNAVLEHLAAH